MQTLKEKLKEFYKSDKFPIVIFMIFICLIHIFMQKRNDDLFFSTVCNETNLLDFLIQRYQTWSSRIWIEGILIIFSNFLPMFIWKMANIGMFYLLIYSISKLFINKNKRNLNIVLCLLLMCIPIVILREAGWMATMNNYLWVGATGLYAMIPLKKIINNERISKIQGLTYILSIIYASNQEQMAGILFLSYSFVLINIIKEKKYKSIFFINYAIIIMSIIFIMICPGNNIRSKQEENTWYQGYSDLSIISKISQGITSMMYFVVEDDRLLFYILLILTAYIVWNKYNKTLYKFIGISPLILTIVFKEIVKLLNYFGKNVFMESNIFIMFKVAIFSLIIILLGISIYLVFDIKKRNILKKILPIFIYFVGFISRFIMAFSPTIYASGERTSFFWYISFCILIILIIQKHKIS